MKYSLLCFQISGKILFFFNEHNYEVSTIFIKENKRYKGIKTAKWFSFRKLVPGFLLTSDPYVVMLTFKQKFRHFKSRVFELTKPNFCLNQDKNIESGM